MLFDLVSAGKGYAILTRHQCQCGVDGAQLDHPRCDLVFFEDVCGKLPQTHILFEGQEAVVFEVFQVDPRISAPRFALGEQLVVALAGRADDDLFPGEQLAGIAFLLQPGLFQHGKECDLDCAVHQIPFQRLDVLLVDLDLIVGEGFPERRQDMGQDGVSAPRRDPHGDNAPVGLDEGAQRGVKLLLQAEDLPRRVQIQFSGHRGDVLPVLPLEQRRAQLLFQLDKEAAQRRLRDEQPFGRFGEVFLLCNDNDIFHLPVFHG